MGRSGRRRAALLEMLDRLINAGNTVLVIEHNLDVIKTADRVIDKQQRGRTRLRRGAFSIGAKGCPWRGLKLDLQTWRW